MNDPDDDLERFVRAQAGVYHNVRDELQAGRKASHWMWFIFPQLKSLGRSETARFYGLANVHEAKAYLDHVVLGARLRECCTLVLAIQGRTALDIFGTPDTLKLCSCMTLFEAVAPCESVFGDVLQNYYGGRRDAETLRLMAGSG